MNKAIISSLVGALAIGLIAYGFIGGWLFAGFKGPQQSVYVGLNGCDSEIGKYNEIYSGKMDSDGLEAAIKEAKESIKDRSDRKSDATCSFMLTWLSVSSGDMALAKEALGDLKAASEKGALVSLRLSNLSSADSLEYLVEASTGEGRPMEGIVHPDEQ